jgi:hypothetical protein
MVLSMCLQVFPSRRRLQRARLLYLLLSELEGLVQLDYPIFPCRRNGQPKLPNWRQV